VIVPLVGTRFVPVRDKRFIAGLKAWNGRQVYVSRGVGNVGGVRVNCRPEVTLLDLTA
jgi:predicted MPP superfamily phosphohydrolase